jgi:hypothetical protein
VAAVSGVPQWDVPFSMPGRLTEADPLPPPTKLIGIAGLAGHTGTCGAVVSDAMPAIRYAGDFSSAERDANGVRFRWMGTHGKLEVGDAGENRPALLVTADTTSFGRDRSLSVRVDGGPASVLLVPSGSRFARLEIPIAAGVGPATITLDTDPPADPASTVNPADSRLLGISLANVELVPVSESD